MTITNPYSHLLNVAHGHKNGLVFHFKEYSHNRGGKYKNGGEVVHDEYVISSQIADMDWLQKKLKGLKPNINLVVSSLVLTHAGEILHMPMADCDGKFEFKDFAEAAQRTDFFDYFGSRPLIVDSGRSFHIYGTDLVKEQDWHAMMGSLLLVGDAEFHPIDVRWVGRRLATGYGGLRLSCNGNGYLKVPEIVGYLNKWTGKVDDGKTPMYVEAFSKALGKWL